MGPPKFKMGHILRDVAMANNFTAKFWYTRSFSTEVLENGLQYRYSDSKMLNYIPCKYDEISQVTPDIMRVTNAPL